MFSIHIRIYNSKLNETKNDQIGEIFNFVFLLFFLFPVKSNYFKKME